jgi:hypothetical protein
MGIKTIRRATLGIAGSTLLLLLATSSSAQQASSESSTSAATPLGAITGRVVSSGGDPLSGATVYLSTIGVAYQPRSTSVDANGNFKLDALDAGVYSVSASAPGFITEARTPDNDTRRYLHPGDSLTITLIKGGVITGTVISSTNTPVVNANVRAFRVKDENGQTVQVFGQGREWLTDDRGVYRMYSLQPGAYLVSAGGPGRFFGPFVNQYENDAPTYAPSSTRDTAAEIYVHSGEEITADIQYRGEPGHSISGMVTGMPQTQSMLNSNAQISLTDARTRAVIMSANASSFNNSTFAFYGVGDGEYELFAQRYVAAPGEFSTSGPRRIKVQGADVSGINLTLAPMAAIAGRLVLESIPPADCVKNRSTAARETVIESRRFTPETKAPARPQSETTEVPLSIVSPLANAVPDAKGDFVLRNLYAGSYRIEPQLSSGGWYLRSIGRTPNNGAKAPETNIARDGITLKTGERFAGLTVIVTEGAGRVRGHVSIAGGQHVPAGLRVYLVPTEPEQAENVLHFFESAVETDASFAITNIAPGHYWIIARSADDGDSAKVKPIRQESALRARVLHEAGALKKEIAFKPCERLADFDLPYSTSSPKQ